MNFDPDKWPKAHGKLLCTPTKPMPDNRDCMGQAWFHTHVECETKPPYTQTVWKCLSCGKTGQQAFNPKGKS